MSFCFYFIFFYLLRFRRKQVKKDIIQCFPEKRSSEILTLEKKIYRHFCDFVCEAIKSYSMTEKDIFYRVKVKNPELLDQYFSSGKSCLLYCSHRANWEWLPILGYYFPSRIESVYKRIHNRRIDQFIKLRREAFSAKMIEQKKFFRRLKEAKREKIQSGRGGKAYILISDQRPRLAQDSVLLDFLGCKTKFLTGPEKVSKIFDLDILYLSMEKTKRGFYEIEFIPFGKSLRNKDPNYLTRILVEQLESDIKKSPDTWFWLHNRWKS